MKRAISVVVASITLLLAVVSLALVWQHWNSSVKGPPIIPLELKAVVVLLCTIAGSFAVLNLLPSRPAFVCSRRGSMVRLALFAGILGLAFAFHAQRIVERAFSCAHCHANLLAIKGVKEIYQIEHQATNGTVVKPSDLDPYFGPSGIAGQTNCLAGGTIHIGKLGEAPWCSFHITCTCPKGPFGFQ